MLPDPILQMLGLARKAGRLETGEEPVGAVCRARQARLVLVAADAAPNTVRRADHFCQAGACPKLVVPFSKLDLGFQVSRGPCAILAITDPGFAAAIAEKLAARDPSIEETALELRKRANRAIDRQREQRQHDKNLREGKRHPWAPPPPPPPAESRPAPRSHTRSSPRPDPRPAKGAGPRPDSRKSRPRGPGSRGQRPRPGSGGHRP